MWAPDTYEGAPTPATAFISVAPKLAGFAVLIRVFNIVFSNLKIDYLQILFYFSILSMTLGNLVAIVQKDIKRMLAYSSIAQAGYIIIGFISNNSENFGIQGILIYLFAYTFTNLGAFTVAIILENNLGNSLISSYAGLSQTSPQLSFAMSIFLLSLLGVPPLSGFFGKFYVFASAIKEGFFTLALIAIVNSVISAYYYLQVIRNMYLLPPKDETKISTSSFLNLAVNTSLFITLFFILFSPVFDFLRSCNFVF
jgi:NADH-quinone oxidoreductase subunit N